MKTTTIRAFSFAYPVNAPATHVDISYLTKDDNGDHFKIEFTGAPSKNQLQPNYDMIMDMMKKTIIRYFTYDWNECEAVISIYAASYNGSAVSIQMCDSMSIKKAHDLVSSVINKACNHSSEYHKMRLEDRKFQIDKITIDLYGDAAVLFKMKEDTDAFSNWLKIIY